MSRKRFFTWLSRNVSLVLERYSPPKKTGGPAGTYYAYGNVLAQYITNNAGVAVTAVTSGGSAANIDLLDLEEATNENLERHRAARPDAAQALGELTAFARREGAALTAAMGGAFAAIRDRR